MAAVLLLLLPLLLLLWMFAAAGTILVGVSFWPERVAVIVLCDVCVLCSNV